MSRVDSGQARMTTMHKTRTTKKNSRHSGKRVERAHPESYNIIRMIKKGYVYIMANGRPTLYTGVTNNLVRRVFEHKIGKGSYFTSKYFLDKLVYYEIFDTIEQAIIREKQIKDMNRIDKIEMIKKFNPDFNDLYKKII